METLTQLERVLLRPMEAAAVLSVGRSTIYAMISSGELPVVRVGVAGRAVRVPVHALKEWIRRNTEQAESAGDHVKE